MKTYWIKVIVSVSVSLAVLLGINEYLLSKARHLKTIVSDEDLWCMERGKVKNLSDQDIILLGASRMQVNIDLSVMKKHFPGRQILQLSLSGRGSAWPVFKDLVENTNFSGTILMSENQATLPEGQSPQEGFVDYYYKSWSLDKKLNKKISMWFQQRFLFLNPNSNSERLWGNVLGKRKLPPPMFTMTYPSREQTSFFDITDTEWIYEIRMKGVRSSVNNIPPEPEDWLDQVTQKKELLDRFKAKGGRPVLISMPLSQERWEMQNSWMPKSLYWDRAMELLEVKAFHFADYATLNGHELPDTSHLNVNSKKEFTTAFSGILKNFFK